MTDTTTRTKPDTPDSAPPTDGAERRCPLRRSLSAVGRLLGPGYAFLTAPPESLANRRADEFRHAWLAVMLLAALWGLLSMHLWQGALDVFYKVRVRYRVEIAPWLGAGAVIAVGGWWFLRQSLLALGRLLGGRSPEGRALALSVLVALWTMTLLSLERMGDEFQDMPYYLPAQWQWLLPYPWYRAMLLAPLWGAWAMLITPQFCRWRTCAEPATAALAGGCGPLLGALLLAAPLAPTLLYFNYMGPLSPGWLALPKSAVMAGATALGAVAGGAAACRWGGLRRDALLALNFAVQLLFLLAYVATR